jgi:hypothetical protein
MTEENSRETRQERRADRLRRRKARMKKHGKSLRKVYLDAVKKKAKRD